MARWDDWSEDYDRYYREDGTGPWEEYGEGRIPHPDDWEAVTPVTGNWGFDVELENGDHLWLGMSSYDDWQAALDDLKNMEFLYDFDIESTEYEEQ